jgi:Fe-S cluster assembly iron-binding protein IscA
MKNIFSILGKTTEFETIPTNVIGAGGDEDIIITQKAMSILISEYRTNYNNEEEIGDYFVRLLIYSTPNNAKQYNIKFDNTLTDFDITCDIDDLKFVIDRKSLFYFMGIIIDYITYDENDGFVFLDTDDEKVNDYYRILAGELEISDALSEYFLRTKNIDINKLNEQASSEIVIGTEDDDAVEVVGLS